MGREFFKTKPALLTRGCGPGWANLFFVGWFARPWEHGVTDTSYSSEYHTPVLVSEVLGYLGVRSGGLYLDGTLGGGGHSEAILDKSSPDGRVVAIDRDPAAHQTAKARLAKFGDRLTLVLGNYGEASELVAEHGLFDGFLVDAGVSSNQLDDRSRGFSFREEGPLDMRMGPDAQDLKSWLHVVSEEELANVIYKYGEIRASRRAASAIKAAQVAGELETTRDLARVIERVLGTGGGAGRKTQIHPATLVFQALRIAINDELTTLEAAVASVPKIVKPGGCAVFISFHSLEDRIVKQGFKELAGQVEESDPVLRKLGLGEAPEVFVDILTKKPVEAGTKELALNPRARSARLRAVRVR